MRLSIKTLNNKTVGRAKRPEEVLLVCLRHNLRREDQDFRHRARIELPPGMQNDVLLGSHEPQVCAEVAASILEHCEISPKRSDTIMGLELVFQPPQGWDCASFYGECLAWARQHYQHPISAVVHRDQKRPHMHLLVLAVKDQRLAGAELSSHGNRLMARRRSFNEHMRAQLGLRADRASKRTSTDILISPGKGAKTHEAERRRDADLVRSVQRPPGLKLVHSTPVGAGAAAGMGAPMVMPDLSNLLAQQPPGPGNLLPPTSSLRQFAQAVLSFVSLVEPMARALASDQSASVGAPQASDLACMSAYRLHENPVFARQPASVAGALPVAPCPSPGEAFGTQAGTQLGTQGADTPAGAAAEPHSTAPHAAVAC